MTTCKIYLDIGFFLLAAIQAEGLDVTDRLHGLDTYTYTMLFQLQPFFRVDHIAIQIFVFT